MSQGITVEGKRGIYLPELDLWLDPHGRKNRAFISHAHSDHFGRHDFTICSPQTRRLIENRYGVSSLSETVSPGWREEWRDRGFTLKMLPAGHILGSAMLHVRRESDGATLLYTGDYKLRPGLSAERAELEEADTLIMETTFGLPQFLFPPSDRVVADVIHFCRAALEDGDVPVLFAYSLGKAQEIMAALTGSGLEIMAHSSVAKLMEIYEQSGVSFAPWKPFHAPSAVGHALLFPPGTARSVELRKLKNPRTAMLSGWALIPGAKFRYQVDEVFPLSDHADYAELLETVWQVKPRLIYTVHGYVSEFAGDLRARGHEAWTLGKSDQLELSLSLPGTVSMDAPETTSAPREPEAASGFALWASTAAAVAEASRLKKQSLLAAYLRELDSGDLARATRWFSARLDDPVLRMQPLQMGWATIRQALLLVTGLKEREYRQLSRSQNDTGRTAYLALRQWREAHPAAIDGEELSLAGVDELLGELREARGSQAKAQVFAGTLKRISPLEGGFLVRLLTGDLRIGSKEGLVEEAVALAFDQPAADVREAGMMCGDPGRAAVLASQSALKSAAPALFVPLKVMLASPEESSEAIWGRLALETKASTVWLEEKYDGIRAQLHLSRDRFEIFSRDLMRVTEQFPELRPTGPPAHEMILDSEIIAFDEAKKLTFHDLQKRLGRKGEADFFLASDIQVKVVVFDLLWLDGRSLLSEPLSRRRELLEALSLPPGWERIEVHFAGDAIEIERAFHAARRAGNEGLIAKDRASLYTPGRRGKSWLKLKKAFSTLDVVVVKAEQGHGKRSHVISDYTFAVRDETGRLRVIGKAYSGLTDLEIEELTEHFTEHTVSQRGNVRTVTPNVVLEIAFDSIRASSRHDSGLAMRFPRIKSIRRDKSPDEINTLAYARTLAGLGDE